MDENRKIFFRLLGEVVYYYQEAIGLLKSDIFNMTSKKISLHEESDLRQYMEINTLISGLTDENIISSYLIILKRYLNCGKECKKEFSSLNSILQKLKSIRNNIVHAQYYFIDGKFLTYNRKKNNNHFNLDFKLKINEEIMQRYIEDVKRFKLIFPITLKSDLNLEDLENKKKSLDSLLTDMKEDNSIMSLFNKGA